MTPAFLVVAGVALVSTILAVTRRVAVHALLYLVVSLLAVAGIFWQLGAPFAAMLEMIVYAGAIVVLFVFVVMMLDPAVSEHERSLLTPRAWIGPSFLGFILLAELGVELFVAEAPETVRSEIGPKEVGIALYGPYMMAAELASMLLLAGLVGAFHLGQRPPIEEQSP